MNRKIILLSTALMATMMLSLAIAPAIAKPNTITITLVNSAGDPYQGVWVKLRKSGATTWGSWLTNSRGKANCDISSWSWVEGDVIEIATDTEGPILKTITLNRQLSARVTVIA